MKFKESKETFVSLLRSTKRNGIESVIEHLEQSDFFTSPASSMYHGSFRHGLLHHSLDVYRQLKLLAYVENKKVNSEVVIPEESIVISSLLHDVCKINSYEWRFVRNIKDENGQWHEKFDWKKKTNDLPVGHGERSVILLLRWGLELTDAEICAIRWHMGAFDLSQYVDVKSGFNDSTTEYHIVPLLQTADLLATRFVDNKELYGTNIDEDVEEQLEECCG